MTQLRWESPTYRAADGSCHEAVRVGWAEVGRCLGRPHDGKARDALTIALALVDAGAPDWVREAPGHVNDDGWWIIRPVECPTAS